MLVHQRVWSPLIGWKIPKTDDMIWVPPFWDSIENLIQVMSYCQVGVPI